MVLIARANGLDRVRVGVVASRKVGSAVVRNRCKRLLREAARNLSKTVDRSGVDLLLIARPPCRSARIGAIHAEAQALCVVSLARIPRPSSADGTEGL
jgi:ribonuclease P protein component